MKKKRDRFLKFIISYKAFMGIVELALAVGFYKYIGKSAGTSLLTLASQMNLNTDNRVISAAIKQAGMIGDGTAMSISAVMVIIGILNCVEAVGLHYRQRWAEWLTVIATGALIPFELYAVIHKVSLFKIFILILNIAIVYYLGKHKELFRKKSKMRARAAIEHSK